MFNYLCRIDQPPPNPAPQTRLERQKHSARNDPPAEGRRLSRAGCFLRSGRGYALGAAATVFFIHSVVTLLGRSSGAPIARLMINCDSMPIARETENSTV